MLKALSVLCFIQGILIYSAEIEQEKIAVINAERELKEKEKENLEKSKKVSTILMIIVFMGIAIFDIRF